MLEQPNDPDESTRATPKQHDESNIPAPPLNPRLQALATKTSTLSSTLSDLRTQKATLVSTSTLPSGLSILDSWSEEEKTASALSTANVVIKEHITLLHRYNEIKDIAQGLMGLIAEGRGVRVKVVMEEFGMGEGD
jgi:hypothetical protein